MWPVGFYCWRKTKRLAKNFFLPEADGAILPTIFLIIARCWRNTKNNNQFLFPLFLNLALRIRLIFFNKLGWRPRRNEGRVFPVSNKRSLFLDAGSIYERRRSGDTKRATVDYISINKLTKNISIRLKGGTEITANRALSPREFRIRKPVQPATDSSGSKTGA